MGHFINYYLPFQETDPSDEPKQALQIVKEAEKLIKAGSTLVGIVYSANYSQTLNIHKTYKFRGWNTNTSGENQAEVMRQMELLLGGSYSHLQGKLQIVPITTMIYPPGTKQPIEYVQDDLDAIESMLKNGADILGWMNQRTKPAYAVGGGIAGALPPAIDTLIQSTLSGFASNYPPKSGILRGAGPGKKTYSLTDPRPGHVTIKGKNYSFLAFYYPGKKHITKWDIHYGTPYFGNFYACDFDVTIDGVKGSFHNGEAAYQASKWWHDPAILPQFEKCITGQDAIDLRDTLTASGTPENRVRMRRREAMFEVCKAKFSVSEFKAKILATGDAYLLEHNAKVGRDKNWSDNNDGKGHNWLGLELMKVRAYLGGSGEPGTEGVDYEIADFTAQVKIDVPGS